MKKIIFMALVVMASALNINAANDKKDKKSKKDQKMECCQEGNGECCNQMVTLTSQRDSVSYAAGMATTQGLLPYLQKQMGLDTMYMADFKKGFQEAIERGTDPKYVAYVAGTQIAQQVEKQILPRQQEQFADTPDSIDTDLFYKGFLAGAMNDTTYMKTADAADYARAQQKALADQKNAAWKAENEKWLAVNKSNSGVITLPSGLQYKVLTQGTGTVATKDDNVTVKYEGKMIDGTVFDSSYKRNPDTASFSPSQVIKGWTEALCMMPEGSKWELYIPQELGYGERNTGKIKPFSTLIFTVEVVKVEKKAEATTTDKKTEATTKTTTAKKAPLKKTTKK